ncbi:MAG: hypothetical protein H7256_05880, partial [Bdellovibrio sp.]|nr:hypothetical protein [Bdellovibrio sp.]
MTSFEPERDIFNKELEPNRKAQTIRTPKEKIEANLESEEELKAGTGFMQTLCEAIKNFEMKGYKENLICCFDHLKSQCRKISILPSEIDVTDVYRFENASDPDDQSILYAISIPSKNIKGLYIESYGLYHEDQSDTLRKA